MERHKKAMEEFNKEKEKWYERTVEKKNKIALLRKKLSDANKDLDKVNEALHNLRTATEKLGRRQRTHAGRVLRAVRRDEGVYKHRYRRHRIGVRLLGYQTSTVNFFITWKGL